MFAFPNHLAAPAVAVVMAVILESVSSSDIAVVASLNFHSHLHSPSGTADSHSVVDSVSVVGVNTAVVPAAPPSLSERKQSTSVVQYPYPQTPSSALQMS